MAEELVTLYGPEGQTEEVEKGSDRFNELRDQDWKLRKTSTNTAPLEPKDGQDGMVSVPKEKLDKLFAIVEEQSKKIEMLEEVADVGRIDRYRAEHGGPRPKFVRLSVFQKKIVLGWATVENEVEYDYETDTVSENQTIEVILKDETAEGGMIKKRIPLRVFGVSMHKIDAEVLTTTVSARGQTIFDVEVIQENSQDFPDVKGKKLKIDSLFVN